MADDLNCIASQGYLTQTGLFALQAVADHGYLKVLVIVDVPPVSSGSGGGGVSGFGYGDGVQVIEYTLEEMRDEEEILAILMLATMYRLMK